MGLLWGLNKVYYNVAAQYPTCDHWRIWGSKATSRRAGQGRRKTEGRMKSLRSPLRDRERGSQGSQTARKCSGLSGSVGSIIQHWQQHRQAKNDPWEKNTQSYKFFFNLVPATAKWGGISWSDWYSWVLEIVGSQSFISSKSWINIHLHFLLFLLFEIFTCNILIAMLDCCIHTYEWDWFILCQLPQVL